MAAPSTYAATRDRLEGYFDRTASKAWEALTSDAPVSRVRLAVRAGRDRMRATLLDLLPDDLGGLRVLDAGCGPGEMCVALAERGAEVVGVDLAPSLLAVAEGRLPAHLRSRVSLRANDMTDPALGRFDAVVAMDSLIHYRMPDLVGALGRLGGMAPLVAFTIAPRTPLLAAMHLAGKAFPRADRSPAIVPHAPCAVLRAMPGMTAGAPVSSGFYFSQAMALRTPG
ncbi:Mg-protoporphyrin IX methyltransferase [Hasllibacter halocynthiae]|uniref:Magnesium protoporphyrin IX methyltransferase n=1 Tax=Hasllibacter halocynthiae TaxID=595589 RepID=A0A2T0X2Q7_9RHOB|nr:magnesium protoporphyrin IX methyltransferase [Hasllibacter halocynthiae]PRY93242.1 Mg-protoporphyrin IX methyltransferase [Hasllibacter halocynthiae]